MRRVLGGAAVLAAAAALVVLLGGASPGERPGRFKLELDNAFGLNVGGDFKVAGVRAGTIAAIDLDRRTKHAIVGFEVTERGFGDLRADASCIVQPQSLVGEYFVDCQPGTSSRRLRAGATIPVARTSATVPPDLVNNLLRRPYRERLAFIIGELGAGLAGNADRLNAALRRANPALRETNKVLAILARQNAVLADLATNADRVVGALAENRADVGRWVTEARGTAVTSAERDRDIAAGLRRLPGFLRELEPTMAELGRTADAQRPALRNLAASGRQLERLLENLPPFADASRPALDALGEAGKVGREAAAKAGPTVAELGRYSQGVPELGRNLAIILEHLDDRDHAVEADPRSPGGKGYTGLEALLQYTIDQTLSTNVHDGNVHILKAQPFVGECADYADIAAAKKLAKDCSTALGPNAVGINFPDVTAPAGYDGRDRAGEGAEEDKGLPIPLPFPLPEGPPRSRDDAGRERPEGDGPSAAAPPAPAQPAVPAPQLPNLGGVLPGLPPVEPPKAPDVSLPGVSGRPSDQQAKDGVLDYLLGP